MAQTISAVVKRLYEDELRLAAERWKEAVKKNYLAFIIILAMIVVIILMAVIYYNIFNKWEWNVANGYAQIEKELQRRSDLIENLFPAVLDYARLERDVFKHISDVRVDYLRGDTAKDSSELEVGAIHELPVRSSELKESIKELSDNLEFKDVMARLMAIAEQYPNLRSSEPYRLLMEKLTEIEDRIADSRGKYNDTVNIYNRKITAFPGFFFARSMRFTERSMYKTEEGARILPELSKYESGGNDQ